VDRRGVEVDVDRAVAGREAEERREVPLDVLVDRRDR
jgi:hypothetical protein